MLLIGRRLEARLALVGLVVAAALLLCQRPASADVETPSPLVTEKEHSSRLFLTLAPGLGTTGLVGLAAITVEVETIRITARALLSGSIDFEVSPTDKIEEYALLLGKAWHKANRTLYLGAGIARAHTTRAGRFLYQEDEFFQTRVHEELNASLYSVPIAAGMGWHGKGAGIGLALVGNLNTELPMLGAVLTVDLGKTW